uniref:Putative Sugar Porter n=1 Tax=Yarrowia galli TaxID=197054 RepID=A0A1N6MC48_9ASCO|nr:putative Sugar Porter [Yarrowia galli]
MSESSISFKAPTSPTTPTTERPLHAFREWENSLTLWNTLRIYRKCVFWSLVMCCLIVMDGYDGFLIPSFYAVSSFQRKFGVQLPDASWTIEAKWQTAFMVGSPIGRITGALGVGLLADKYGRKKVTLVPLALLTGIIFIVFFAKDKAMLCVGWTLSGLIWGVFNTMAPTYVSEICPVSLRSTFAAAINLSWVIGQFISTAVLTASESQQNQWSYRIPLAVQWFWPLVLIPLIAFMPESPWWTLKQGDEERTRKVLERLVNKNDVDIDTYLEYMCHTIQEEDDSGKFSDCFKGADLRRTEICCFTYFVQPLSGLYLLSYVAYFLQLTGIPRDVVFKMTLGITAVAVLASLVSPLVILHFKRRTLYMGSLTLMACTLLAIGITQKFDTQAARWAAGILVFVWVGTYDTTIGPLTYVIVSETSSVQLRSKTVALASISNSLIVIVLHVTVPYLMNEEEAHMGAYVAFVWAPFCIMAIIWAFFRLPELKGMSFLEIEQLFQNERARKVENQQSKHESPPAAVVEGVEPVAQQP